MMNPRKPRFRSGLTLVELLMVLVILAATAAMVVPLIDDPRITSPSGEEKSPEQIATEATMHKIRDVIMGTNNHQGVWADLGQRPELFPQNVSTLLQLSYAGVSTFDPVTKIGWRGPYFAQSTGTDASGFPTLVDAWGNPIVIQIPDLNGDGDNVSANELEFVRLVSAGEADDDGVHRINTPPNAAVPTLDDRGNDIVLFLRMTDPFANP